MGFEYLNSKNDVIDLLKLSPLIGEVPSSTMPLTFQIGSYVKKLWRKVHTRAYDFLYYTQLSHSVIIQ